jgi:chemotaxis protein CheX
MEIANDIHQITQSIWKSVLGFDVQSRSLAEVPLQEEHTLASCVQITGAWEGAVALQCSTQLARQVAGAMFNIAPENASIEEIQDALGELINMTGGNIKALLAEPCLLSLPTVVEGSNYTLRIPGSVLVSQVAFSYQGLPFLVTLLEKKERQAREG